MVRTQCFQLHVKVKCYGWVRGRRQQRPTKRQKRTSKRGRDRRGRKKRNTNETKNKNLTPDTLVFVGLAFSCLAWPDLPFLSCFAFLARCTNRTHVKKAWVPTLDAECLCRDQVGRVDRRPQVGRNCQVKFGPSRSGQGMNHKRGIRRASAYTSIEEGRRNN